MSSFLSTSVSVNFNAIYIVSYAKFHMLRRLDRGPGRFLGSTVLPLKLNEVVTALTLSKAAFRSSSCSLVRVFDLAESRRTRCDMTATT